VPNDLSADSDWQVLSSVADFRLFIGVLFIAILLFVAFLTSKKNLLRPISFGILWYFLALIPSSSIIPLGEVLNDHRMFFPLIGLAFGITWALALIIVRIINSIKTSFTSYKPVLVLIAILFLSAYAYGTNERNKVWHTPESLWYDVTQKSPKNARGLMNYGIELMGKGKYQEAIGLYNKTVELWPYYSYGYINLGVAYGVMGNVAAAEENFKKGIAYGPNVPDAYSFYAQFLINNKRNTEAKTLIDKGLAISPQHSLLLAAKQQNDAAMANNMTLAAQNTKQLSETVKTSPSAENYLNLSLQYYNQEDFVKCIEAAEQSLKYKPDYDLAYNNICAAYNRLGKWNLAIAAAEKGLKINPNNTLLRNNMEESKRNLQQH